jgi:hypothetical protein
MPRTTTPIAARFPVGVVVAATALAGITVWHSLRLYLPTLNTPHTSLEAVPHAPSKLPPLPGLARRLTVIVLDGLSYDAARGLDELMPLRRQGVLRSLAVEFPSFTSPAVVSFMTGLDPRDSGTRLNGELGGVRGLDAVTRAAGDVHVPVSVWSRGYADFAGQLAPPAGTPVHLGRFAMVTELGRRGLVGARGLEPMSAEKPAPARALELVHWGMVDDVGHVHGARSPEYAQAARDAAAFVVRYARSLDFDQDALVVVSDHGHLPDGGHGGHEDTARHALFLGVGPLFRRGVELGERPLRDVASTLSVLAGLRTPSSNLGLPMLDALALDDEQTSFVLGEPFDEASRFVCQLRPDPRCASVAPLLARLRKPDPLAWEEVTALHAALTADRSAELAARREDGAHDRLAVTAAVLALGLLGLLLARRRAGVSLGDGLAPPAALLPFLHAGVFVGYVAAIGYRPSFSYLKPVIPFLADVLPGAFLATAAAALFAWVYRPGRHGGWVLMLGTAAPFALLAAWVGWDPVTLPPPMLGTAVFHLAPGVISAAAAAVLVAMMETRPAGPSPRPPPTEG